MALHTKVRPGVPMLIPLESHMLHVLLNVRSYSDAVDSGRFTPYPYDSSWSKIDDDASSWSDSDFLIYSGSESDSDFNIYSGSESDAGSGSDKNEVNNYEMDAQVMDLSKMINRTWKWYRLKLSKLGRDDRIILYDDYINKNKEYINKLNKEYIVIKNKKLDYIIIKKDPLISNKDDFIKLNNDIIKLINAVLTESYYLTSVKFAIFRKRSSKRSLYRLITPVSKSSRYIIGLNIDKVEVFLLLALGYFLNKLFREKFVYSVSSLAYTSDDEASSLETYVRTLRRFDQVKCLLLFDFSESMRRIPVSRLLSKLKPLLHPYIYNLTRSYLEMPFTNEDTGVDIRRSGDVTKGETELDLDKLEGFPLVSNAGNVLFNFYLDELDKSIEKEFPALEYVRYKHEVVIPIYIEYDICQSEFDLAKFTNLYKELNLECRAKTIASGGLGSEEFVGGYIYINRLGFISVINTTGGLY